MILRTAIIISLGSIGCIFTIALDSAAQRGGHAPVDMPAADHPAAVVITKGGTYRGRWRSDDPDVPAVTIRTKEPVTLEDCEIIGAGTLISSRYGAAELRRDGVNPRNTHSVDLTVRNCKAVGVRPELSDRAPPRFLVALNPRRILLENNTIEGTRGISIFADPDRTPPERILIRSNRAMNLDGRCHNRCSSQNINGWVSRSGIAVANFVQLANIRAGEVDISWNLVRNEPGKSAVEDVISLFRVAGTADRPVNVAHNLILGAFPGRDPFDGAYSGSAIMIDGSGVPASAGSSWIRVFGNRVLYASNVGIGIASGNNNRVFSNIVLRPSRYINGREITTRSLGIYVWRCCGDPAIGETFFGNVAHSNAIFVESYRDGAFALNNLWVPDCARDPEGESLCVGNVSLTPALVRAAAEQLLAEWGQARFH